MKRAVAPDALSKFAFTVLHLPGFLVRESSSLQLYQANKYATSALSRAGRLPHPSDPEK
jgi:hypothetical protein